MSASTEVSRTAVARGKARRASLHNQRRWALWGSYAALAVFVVIFLVPPFYTIITSLKSSAEMSAQTGNPWIVQNPTLDNYLFLLTCADIRATNPAHAESPSPVRRGRT